MLVAHISDTHIMAPKEPNERSLERINFFQRCVKDINSLRTIPDVVIHTGDLTDNGLPQEYVIAKDILKGLNVPFFLTPGNRDGSISLMDSCTEDLNISKNHNSKVYAVNEFSIRLISIDTSSARGPKGDLSKKKLQTLKSLLNDYRDKPTLLFMHHPPFSISFGEGSYFEYDQLNSLKEFNGLIQNYTQIIGLFCGHIHRTYNTTLGNIAASVMPSIALDLSQERISNKVDLPVYHLHKFYDGLRYETEIRHT
jgi:3',5'-cyclic-AMP phosphodiesterase